MKDDSRDAPQIPCMMLRLKPEVSLHVDLDARVHPAQPLPDLPDVLPNKIKLSRGI